MPDFMVAFKNTHSAAPSPPAAPAPAPAADAFTNTSTASAAAASAQAPAAANRPSLFYMIMTIVTMIILLGTAALTTVHYLKVEHQVDVEIPGIPFGK